MHNYTMTFKYDGEFDLPDDEESRKKEVSGMVLEKLEKHEFELVDFNLTQNYDREYAKVYIDDPFLHRSVLEIKLDLTIADMKNREAIYARCLKALQDNEVVLEYAFENDDKKNGMLQSIIVFENKEGNNT
ncbi:hypothetical protein [Flavobacterium sp. NRK1]|uniref:hypothetical protein n=1 Tax=Flavobacterium sp. NRK1 TaxID=2954929 RepID=UPI002092DAAF|nr:hypothetical protein [Flavobacterium sp. NRK1]MCO6146967.1 hypothetical protein [Flavobacterium sp. NRK1]